MTDPKREQIANELIERLDPHVSHALSEAQLDAIADAVRSMIVPPSDALIDQGVTRLQLLAFLRGDDSDVWNWNGLNDGPRWVRFRGHVIDRWDTLDGQIVRLTYTEHDGVTRPASWTMRQTADLDYNAAAVARNIDQIIDAVIAEYGPDGVA